MFVVVFYLCSWRILDSDWLQGVLSFLIMNALAADTLEINDMNKTLNINTERRPAAPHLHHRRATNTQAACTVPLNLLIIFPVCQSLLLTLNLASTTLAVSLTAEVKS